MAIDAEEAGMDAFMEKPFKLEELTAVYTKILERDHRHANHQTTLTPGVDTESLGVVVCGPRSICKVTLNAKIFVDASELGEMIASQTGGVVPVTFAVSESAEKGEVVASMADKPATYHVPMTNNN